ncbi:selenoprotein Pb-like [Ostrea edulis]|uniref:selenoprotein Pb-like n=1 Tax=Ostrea edulis TaxID=37623 RepID=UPI0020949150|nr:selenoprotein Pb-like [Ostrea edulis]
MCQQQAEGLETLRNAFHNGGTEDITFFIVNSVRAKSSIQELTRRVSFPVYQDESDLMIQQKLNGAIDDLFIYDRCGILAYHLTKPDSLVSQGTMQRKIVSTYLDNHCNCSDGPQATAAETQAPEQRPREQSNTPTSPIRRRRHAERNSGSSFISMNSAASHPNRIPK